MEELHLAANAITGASARAVLDSNIATQVGSSLGPLLASIPSPSTLSDLEDQVSSLKPSDWRRSNPSNMDDMSGSVDAFNKLNIKLKDTNTTIEPRTTRFRTPSAFWEFTHPDVYGQIRKDKRSAAAVAPTVQDLEKDNAFYEPGSSGQLAKERVKAIKEETSRSFNAAADLEQTLSDIKSALQSLTRTLSRPTKSVIFWTDPSIFVHFWTDLSHFDGQVQGRLSSCLPSSFSCSALPSPTSAWLVGARS